MTEMNRVLLIEDDADIVQLLLIHLHDLGCEVEIEHNGKQGFAKAKAENFNLIVLDIMLPGMDGIEVCGRLRALDIYTPVLMLTAKSEEIDKVLGLESGADDYLTKPFSIREFIARVKAMLRRAKISAEVSVPESTIQFNGLAIDTMKRKVMLNDQRIELTPKEFSLLLLLASSPGRSYSREELLDLVWGYEFSGYEHTVNSHVNRLRAKIEADFEKPTFILTTWGLGYRFNDELPSKKSIA
jgi:two-component system, OmpR family, alkaline phosphatase synthesis response regulator PhoP